MIQKNAFNVLFQEGVVNILPCWDGLFALIWCEYWIKLLFTKPFSPSKQTSWSIKAETWGPLTEPLENLKIDAMTYLHEFKDISSWILTLEFNLGESQR